MNEKVNYKNLVSRLKTAAILLGILAAFYLISYISGYSSISFATLGLVVTLMAAYEIGRLLAKRWELPIYFFILSCPAILVWLRASFYLKEPTPALLTSHIMLGFFISVILGLIFLAFKCRGDIKVGEIIFRDLWPSLIHVGIGGAALVALAFVPNHGALIFWLMWVVFWNDVAAYFVGSRFAGPKLVPNISPSKTFSGAIGGFVGGLIAGLILNFVFSFWSILNTTILILLLVLTAQLGDLNKSYLKRIYNVKDLGTLLPGHGGVMDRLDGLFLAAPLLLFWLSL